MKLNSLEAARLPLPPSSSKEERGKEGGIRFPSSPPRQAILHGLFVPRESLHFAPRYYVKQIRKQQIRNEIKPGFLPCNFIHVKLGPNRRHFHDLSIFESALSS